MCGKDISNHDAGRSTVSFPKEDNFVCYDVCRDCANKIEEFIKVSHKYFCEPIVPEEQEAIDKWKEDLSKLAMFNKDQNKCDKEHCEGCESFKYTSSVLNPDKLHIRCNKTNHFGIVDLGQTVKPEDFYEED